jgi:hypothetical protein
VGQLLCGKNRGHNSEHALSTFVHRGHPDRGDVGSPRNGVHEVTILSLPYSPFVRPQTEHLFRRIGELSSAPGRGALGRS